MLNKTFISHEELNEKFREALLQEGLVKKENLNTCSIGATELVELDLDGSNWTNPVIRANNIPADCYIQIVINLKKQFNINFA